jgi:hypothetical protein
MRVSAVLAAGCAVAAMVCMAGTAKADPKTHDGFYLQLDVGLGYLSSTADSGVPQIGEVTYSGVTIPSALLLGGTVGPVVIGGGFFGDYAFSPSVERGGESAELEDVTLTLFGIGLFADFYPDPHGGLHIQPFLGYGGLEASYQGDAGGSDPTGPVFAVGVGYDWWVADEWSIGVMGRFAYAPLKLEDTSFNTIAPAVLATFTYH